MNPSLHLFTTLRHAMHKTDLMQVNFNLHICRLIGCTSLLSPAQQLASSYIHTSTVTVLPEHAEIHSFTPCQFHYSLLRTTVRRGSKKTAEETSQVTGATDEAATVNRTEQVPGVGEHKPASNKDFASATTASSQQPAAWRKLEVYTFDGWANLQCELILFYIQEVCMCFTVP